MICAGDPLPPEPMAILPGLALRIGNELGNAFHRKRWIYLHDLRHAHNAPDRCGVADEIEVEVCEQGRIDRGVASRNEKRVTVGGRPNDRLGADVGTRARTVLNDELLAEAFRQPLTDQTCG